MFPGAETAGGAHFPEPFFDVNVPVKIFHDIRVLPA
jgi:hypothetical protein